MSARQLLSMQTDENVILKTLDTLNDVFECDRQRVDTLIAQYYSEEVQHTIDGKRKRYQEDLAHDWRFKTKRTLHEEAREVWRSAERRQLGELCSRKLQELLQDDQVQEQAMCRLSNTYTCIPCMLPT